MAGVFPVPVKTSGRKQWTLYSKLFTYVLWFAVKIIVSIKSINWSKFFVGTVGSGNVIGAGLTQVKACLTWQTFEFDSD